jgi:hypothetical protein
MMKARHELDRLYACLREALPGLQMANHQPSSIRCRLAKTSWEISLSVKDGFMYLFSSHQKELAHEPLQLLGDNAALLGPTRLLRREATGAIFLGASWPASVPVEVQAVILAADLHQLAYAAGPLAELAPAQPIEAALKTELRDWTASASGFREVPSDELSWEFLCRGKGPCAARMQIRVEQRHPDVLSLATLVTDWVADEEIGQWATSTLVLLLNDRLRWARLCLRDGALEGEVSIPVRGISRRLWELAREALAQAASLRETLRIIQVPAVASEFERIHGRREASKEENETCVA